MDYQIRSMLASDCPEVSRIYQAGMDTNLATFQSECPAWEEWDASHLKACRLVIAADGKAVGLGGADSRLRPLCLCGRG